MQDLNPGLPNSGRMLLPLHIWGIAVTDQFYWRQHEYFGTIALA